MAADLFSDPEMQEIFEGFLVESQELLDAISQDLMTLENQPDDLDLLNQIFRSFHTIKGTSSFMGFNSIVGITHHAEDLLNKLRKSELVVNQDIIDVLLDVHDIIEILIENIQEDSDEEIDYSDTEKQLEILKSGRTLDETNDHDIAETGSNENKESETFPDDASVSESGESALDKVLNYADKFAQPGDFSPEEESMILSAFDEVNKNFDAKVSLSDFENHQSENAHSETKEINQKVPNSKEVNKTKPSISKEKSKTHKPKASSETIRVDLTRVESLMDLSGELVLGRNRLAQIADIFASEFENNDFVRDLLETTDSIDTITSDIQAAVMRIRMVPVGKLYQKAPRIVRDLSKEFKKKIKLVVKGEETEIDRGIIEELNDPLVHMIRNSCDHGIEGQDERKELDKPVNGTITLDAEQEGNNIVLRISDDGRGMDPEKLKAKALEKGLISQEQAAQMSDREAFQLIFMPGFSTAAVVSSVSGRGVGMDVVRTNIQNLKGMIEIESELGKGSTFVIKLPLTLAIIQGLLVKIQEETYAIPLSSVVEVVSINKEAVSSVNQQEVIRLRDDVYPIIRLDKALHTPDSVDELDGRNIVVVGYGMYRVGFVVDTLLGQQEIVIKSLGEYLGSMPGIAGSTILGDGHVIMIIDVSELIENNLSSANIYNI